MSSSRALCCLKSLKKQKHDCQFFRSMYNKTIIGWGFCDIQNNQVEVGVINRSRRLRLITLTEILIILDITRISSNDCFIIHWTKKMGVMFLLLQRFQATQSAWTWHDYPWPWGSCAWVLAWLSRECYVRNADNDVTDLQMTRTASQRKRGLWHGCMVALHRSKSPKVLI